MTTFSLRPFATAATCLAITAVLGQTNNVAVNSTGAPPLVHGILDVQSTTKGVLIPRMTNTERDQILPTPPQGLTVYVTTPPQEEGFWYFENGIWNHIMSGSQWGLTGNAGTVPGTLPGQNYLGTSDAQPLVFRTNNVERARLDLQGDLGVGVANPLEKLDLLGAIKQTGTAATNTVGTIRYTTYNVAANPGPPLAILAHNYSQHEGNVNGTPTGWRKLENDYTEVKGAPYTAAGSPVVCGGGAANIPVTNSTSNTNIVSPWTVSNAAAHRYRHQYLYRPQDLNVELNQIFGNPAATQGLCIGAQITSIGFNVTVNTGNKAGNVLVSIKHTSQTTLTGFDNAADPASRCFQAVGNQPTAGGGWKTYGPFATPFVWDGVRGIIIEVQGAIAGGAVIANSTVQTRNALTFNGTYSTWGAVCAGSGLCPAGTWSGCGTNGSATEHPVVQFTTSNNGISTAPPAVVSSGDYVHYPGALLAEVPPPMLPANWSQWNADNIPVGDTYYAFKGPGTIAAVYGIYDDSIELSDHVFDRYYDGKVMPQDATRFGAQRILSVEEMATFTEQQRHLPTMKGRSEWTASGGFGLGDITNQLWVTAETQAVYLTELNNRLDGLAVLSGTGPIDNAQLQAAKGAIASMGTLTEGEKATLLQECSTRLSGQSVKP